MLDIREIRENSGYVIERLAARGKDAREEIARILALDERRRAEIQNTEQRKAKQNQLSKQIPLLKKEGKGVDQLMAELKTLSEEIKQGSDALKAIEEELEQVLSLRHILAIFVSNRALLARSAEKDQHLSHLA